VQNPRHDGARGGRADKSGATNTAGPVADLGRARRKKEKGGGCFAVGLGVEDLHRMDGKGAGGR
jgi:hypothetical protein